MFVLHSSETPMASLKPLVALLCLLSLTATAQAQSFAIEASFLSGGLLNGTNSSYTGDALVLVKEGTRLRLVATVTSRPGPPPQLTLSLVQGVSPILSLGPGGLIQAANRRTRVLPDCPSSSAQDCFVPPMATVSKATGILKATAATIEDPARRITVTFVAIDVQNPGSPNASGVPTPVGNCGSGARTLLLEPYYHFDNTALKLANASFFFSAAYLGPAPGDPPCTTMPGGVSGYVGPVTFVGISTDQVMPRSTVYVGSILAVGRWLLVGHSPEVGITVTCEYIFASSGRVELVTNVSQPEKCV